MGVIYGCDFRFVCIVGGLFDDFYCRELCVASVCVFAFIVDVI